MPSNRLPSATQFNSDPRSVQLPNLPPAPVPQPTHPVQMNTPYDPRQSVPVHQTQKGYPFSNYPPAPNGLSDPPLPSVPASFNFQGSNLPPAVPNQQYSNQPPTCPELSTEQSWNYALSHSQPSPPMNAIVTESNGPRFIDPRTTAYSAGPTSFPSPGSYSHQTALGMNQQSPPPVHSQFTSHAHTGPQMINGPMRGSPPQVPMPDLNQINPNPISSPHNSGLSAGQRLPPSAPPQYGGSTHQRSPQITGSYGQPQGSAHQFNSPNYQKRTTGGGPVFRAPGSPTTHAQWSEIKTPIGLLQDYQLLPSDTADLPPRPAIDNPVNCDPDIIRCTLTNVPATSKLLGRCRLPFGLVMHPFKDLSNLHIIQSSSIVRCRSCRAYINPFVQFVDSGRRWRCPVCFLANTVPDDFLFDPVSRSYGDPGRRPEIRCATVEFVAPSEYMIRPPQPATYLFCFDVSHNAVATGYLRFVCERLAASLHRLPGDSRAQIGFITFDSAVHFYKLSENATKMMICPDLDEPFIPDTEGLVNRIAESTEMIREFLLQLPNSFTQTNDTKNCLGSALQVALKLIGSTGGRITVFNTCLPNVGSGSLQNREEQSDRTSIEVKCLGPAIDFYKTFALDCSAQQVAVDLFIMNSQYCDIATLSGVARFSSGFVYHYPDFYCPPSSSNMDTGVEQSDKTATPPVELERFKRDFDRYLTRRIGFEAVMRIRCTHGLTIQTFHGSFFVRSTDLMSLPNVNPDAGYAIQLGISESLEKYSSVCCQVAILYTSAQGSRRIRVHTLCLPVVQNPSEVFLGADQGAIACLIGKMAVDRVISSGLSYAREALANAVSDALSAFASANGLTPAASISSYSMACPPNLRLLALYICGMLRYTAFQVGVSVRVDDRSAALERLKCAPPNDMLALCYPALYAIHPFLSKPATSEHLTLAQKAAALRLSDYGDAQLEPDQRSDGGESTSSEDSDILCEASQLPGQLHLSARSVNRDGVYLLDKGDMLYLLVGSATTTSPDALRQLLGIDSPSDLPASGGPFALPFSLRAKESSSDSVVPVARRRLMALINLLRLRRPIGTALMCMRHDAPAHVLSRFLSALVEDRTEYAPSYPEFLQMVQGLMKG